MKMRADLRQRDVHNRDIELHHDKAKTGSAKQPQERTAKARIFVIHDLDYAG
jgi:hypothetical protein